MSDIGITSFDDRLEENALGFRVGFGRGSVVVGEVCESIKDILVSSVQDAFLQPIKKVCAVLMEYGQEEAFLAAKMLVEHWFGYFACASQFACARLCIGGAGEDAFGALEHQCASLFAAHTRAFFRLM
jgi:hypothetical protein